MDQRKDHGRLYGVDRHNHFQIHNAFAVSVFRIEREANDSPEIFDPTKRRAKYFRRLTRIDQAEMISIRHVVASPARRGVCGVNKNYSNDQTLTRRDNLHACIGNCADESNTTFLESPVAPHKLQNSYADSSRAFLIVKSESRAVPPSRPARVEHSLSRKLRAFHPSSAARLWILFRSGESDPFVRTGYRAAEAFQARAA
jgi:hypothetical protein